MLDFHRNNAHVPPRTAITRAAASGSQNQSAGSPSKEEDVGGDLVGSAGVRAGVGDGVGDGAASGVGTDESADASSAMLVSHAMATASTASKKTECALRCSKKQRMNFMDVENSDVEASRESHLEPHLLRADRDVTGCLELGLCRYRRTTIYEGRVFRRRGMLEIPPATLKVL